MSGPGSELDAFIERYVAVWNEPAGANFTKSSEWRTHFALEARMRGAHEKWVRDGGCVFRARYADAHHGAVRCVWDMVSVADGRVVSIGHELLLLAADGRIREDYQFIEPATASAAPG